MQKDHAATDVCIGVLLIEREDGVEVLERLVEATKLCKCNATIDEGVDQQRIDGERSVELHKRFLGAAEVHERNAATDERFAALLAQGEDFVANRKRCLLAIKAIERFAEGAQRLGRSGIGLKRIADQPEGLDAVALLLSQYSQLMQRVEMIGFCLEDRAVEFFGLGEHSQLVELETIVGGFRYERVVACRW